MLLALGLVLLLSSFPPSAMAEQEPPSAQYWWDRAVSSAAEEQWAAAAAYFERLHREFPSSPMAEEALWRAAGLRKKVAGQSDDPNWERVRDLYRIYTLDYPKSSRADDAYLEMADAHFQMSFYREALTYFRLFEQRYPDSPLVPEARYRQALTLIAVGDMAEAAKLFRALADQPDPDLQIRARLGLGRTRAAAGDHLRAIDIFHDLLKSHPRARFSHPELFYYLGRSNLSEGREEEGSDYLFTYINLAPGSAKRLDALFAVAESLLRRGEAVGARRLYQQIIDEAPSSSRSAVLSSFRLAEHRDATRRASPETSPPPPRDADIPYRQVIEQFGREPIAQEARYSLWRLLFELDDMEGALDLCASYLRQAQPGDRHSERAGELMIFLVKNLLEREEYERIYQLYVNEYRHVEVHQPGRLRFLIGQALERLGLYQQASVVYYRALAGSLDPDELARLYRRRAEVYFALEDFAAADRLLAHLRNLYADTPELAQFLWLSGRLRELEGRHAEAVEFYRRSAAHEATPDAKAQQAPQIFQALLQAGGHGELLEFLGKFQRKGWLKPQELQHWYREAGDGLRRQGSMDEAVAAYRAGVGEGFPAEGEEFQAISLALGEILAARGEFDEASSRFEAARSGPDKLRSSLARQRFNQLIIDRNKREMRSLFE